MKDSKHPCWIPLETHISNDMYAKLCSVATARAEAEPGPDAQFHTEDIVDTALRNYFNRGA